MTCSGDKKSLIFKDCGCGCNGKKQEKKFLIALMSALLFFVIANPATFRIVRKIFGKWVSTPTGCPSTYGLLLHSLVYLLISWGMMNLKKEEKEKKEKKEKKENEEKEEKEEKMEEKGEASKTVPKMVDMPMPEPDMSEEQFPTMDSGLYLDSYDTTDVIDSRLYL
jgi:type III secretory pathway component EscV